MINNEERSSEMSTVLGDIDPRTGKPKDCVRHERDPVTGKKIKMPCTPKPGLPGIPSFEQYHNKKAKPVKRMPARVQRKDPPPGGTPSTGLSIG